MGCGQRDEHPLTPQRLAAKPVMASRTHENRDVDLPCIQASEKDASVSFHTLDLDVGMRVAPAHQRRPQIAGRDRAIVTRHEATGPALTGGAHHRHKLIRSNYNRLRATDESISRQGHRDARARPIENWHPDSVATTP